MTDLISRQDAYNTLTEYYHHATETQHEALKEALGRVPDAHSEAFEWCTDCKEYDHEAGGCHRFGAVIRETVEELKAQRWIPVTERLPETPSFCLVTTDGSHNDVIDIALYMSDGWHKASKVLAWMPLPEPYTEEEE